MTTYNRSHVYTETSPEISAEGEKLWRWAQRQIGEGCDDGALRLVIEHEVGWPQDGASDSEIQERVQEAAYRYRLLTE